MKINLVRPENTVHKMIDFIARFSILSSNKPKDFNVPGKATEMIKKLDPQLYNEMTQLDSDSFKNVRDEDVKKFIVPKKPLSEWVAESRKKK